MLTGAKRLSAKRTSGGGSGEPGGSPDDRGVMPVFRGDAHAEEVDALMRLVGNMTRFLLASLIIGLFALAMLGACLEAVRGKRPAILSRRTPAIA
jgi:hypothetical protein